MRRQGHGWGQPFSGTRGSWLAPFALNVFANERQRLVGTGRRTLASTACKFRSQTSAWSYILAPQYR